MSSVLQQWGSKPLGEIILAWLRSFLPSRAQPDPWPEEIDQAVRDPAAVPVCQHCFTPQEEPTWFCPQCGNSVGQYNNTMPYLYIFSIGEMLRSGTGPEARFTKLTVPGYALLGLLQFSIFAPLYFFRLAWNWSQLKKTAPVDTQPFSGDSSRPMEHRKADVDHVAKACDEARED